MKSNILTIYTTLLIMLSTVVMITDCCSSRAMPKSRPRPDSHFRGRLSKTKLSGKLLTDNMKPSTTMSPMKTTSITESETSETAAAKSNKNRNYEKDKNQLMRMGKCSLSFEENYCLNGGKCYNFTIANSTMPSCECAEGYMGERCESKYLDGTYLTLRQPKIHIETASVYYGAFLALIIVLLLLYCLHCFNYNKVFIKPKKVIS